MKIAYVHRIPDKSSYFKLFESTGWNENYRFNEDQVHDALQQSWYTVAAYDYGELVGIGRILSDGVHHAFIVDLMVLPEYQNRGIGSNILKLLLAECKANGIPDVQLFSANGKSSFYNKYGYTARSADAPGMGYRYAMSHRGTASEQSTVSF